uniref:Nucleolar protein 16 n=1 Tax=Lepisosteus oculatus TaxID=7918 RepID=W5N3J2_LEPOC
MPKAKKSSRRKKFDYTQNRKKLKLKFKKAAAPRIECAQIRNAWDDKKSVTQNLKEMGLAFDPNRSLPIQKAKVTAVEAGVSEAHSTTVKKPYVLNELAAEASLPSKNTRTLSSDMIEYVQYMIQQHNDNYKEMAKDEKNYYQDTPKQIKRKVELYRRYHPEEYAAFMDSLSDRNQDIVSV